MMLKKKQLIVLYIFAFFLIASNIYAGDLQLGSSSYDDLDKLVVCGLAEMSEVGPKPVSRLRAAGVVVEAVYRIREKDVEHVIYSHDLESALLRLSKELRLEVDMIAPGLFSSEKEEAKFISSLIVLEKRLDCGVFDKVKTYDVPNAYGRKTFDGGNAQISAKGDFYYGENLSFSLEPILFYGAEERETLLHQAYCAIGYSNLELKLGRMPMWYGNGYHGSLLLSNNSSPFETIEIKNRESFLLPGFLEYLGLFNTQVFLARLSADREFPRLSFIGTRVEMYPFSFVGVGVNHTAMFGGKGNGGLNGENWLENFIANGAGSTADAANHLTSIDMQVVLPAYLHEYFPLANGLKVFAEMGAEDSGADAGLDFTHKGYLCGAYLPGLFKIDTVDLRLEFAQTDSVWYVHGRLVDGYTYKRDVIGHHMGTDAQDIFAQISWHLYENLLFKFALNREQRLRTQPISETRNELNISMEHDFRKHWTILCGYSFIDITNLENISGRDDIIHIFSVGSKYRF
ncbi:MAG: capsule assembly Wzi family protein [PVC group bacterium]|nr:capsule assembly Wzi family protein [PVC group bacterium]